MQLILSIDDIGSKKNMSSGEETNQSEIKIKTELKDSNLTSSLSPQNESEEDIIEESSQKNVVKTNGTALSDNATKESKNSVITDETENQNRLISEEESEDIDKNTIEIKTEDNVLSAEHSGENECLEEKSSADDTFKKSCEENIDSDKSEELTAEIKAENISNINENEDEKELLDDEIKQELQDNKKIKQESCEYEKSSNEEEINSSADNCLNTDEKDLLQHQQNEENCKENSVKDDVSLSDKENLLQHQQIEDNSNEEEINSSADNGLSTVKKDLLQHQQNEENCKENSIKDDVSLFDKNEIVEESKIDDNYVLDNIENCKVQDCESSQVMNDKVENKNDKNNSTTCSISGEVIDIVDEKYSADSGENEGKGSTIVENPIENNKSDTNSKNEDSDQLKESGTITIDEDIIDIADEKDICDSIKEETNKGSNILKSRLEPDSSDKSSPAENGDVNAKSDVSTSQDSKLKISDSTEKKSTYKLSNTLDILSDDEEENDKTKSEPPKPQEANDKQCINIEEDDDIMVIDDETSTKDEKEETKKVIETALLKKDDEKIANSTSSIIEQNPDKVLEEPMKKNETRTEILKSVLTRPTFPRSPLLSSTALKSFKKNLGEMTREELEDFCILTIAEAVFDRSNLGELKSQLKILSQNFEDHKVKAKNLAKQNRDLQVVLKSIQEEQKKNSEAPITPLKITRSVGMQVLMTEKVSRKRQVTTQMLQNSTPTKQITPTSTPNKTQNKPAASPNVSNTKTPPRQPQQQNIPVPRLVPAVSTGTKPTQNSSPQPNNMKSPGPVPNGVKTLAPKPEKRTHTKMQQSNDVTVDLTDDEPPAKVITRNFNSSVRCVPPQSLLAPRPSLPMTSPRKVYIPISGQQAQNIRPGQHIMLKSVTGVSAGPGRPRLPPPNVKVGPNGPGQIRPRIAHRHPAPLPELMKQYQPPNWKALPPAPELKLSKVENGIVISWKIDGYREENHEEIASYQLFAYQETSQPPSTSLWKKIGDVKALPLPMACTLTQFMSGYKYYFAVRAVDVKSRFGPFSLPGSILLLKN
ncbi:activating transcription factor 7-interacting protein 1 isoform X2 [Aricia agestis]|uniref:activating transcription factor 7-interacting protein 1 isoform X2 n=1 Tax=Aricia agestis TaxID=91739 RepID=UPI001C2056F4|nr:activating transcription factor 7-interacting protein 1 isoform X2 [Aricia agestis]